MFVHPETRMRMLIEHAGFALVRRRRSPMWSADVFVRRDGPETSVVPVATASP
jgi:hypothetical protein